MQPLILLTICFFRTNAGELRARSCFWIHVLLRLFFDLWLALWERNAGLGRPLVWSSKTVLTFRCCQLMLFMFCATSSGKYSINGQNLFSHQWVIRREIYKENHEIKSSLFMMIEFHWSMGNPLIQDKVNRLGVGESSKILSFYYAGEHFSL